MDMLIIPTRIYDVVSFSENKTFDHPFRASLSPPPQQQIDFQRFWKSNLMSKEKFILHDCREKAAINDKFKFQQSAIYIIDRFDNRVAFAYNHQKKPALNNRLESRTP